IVLVTASRSIGGTRYFWLDDDQMVSMRYARNLAEGRGLDWNDGERVEGYTSLGWTLVLAGLRGFPMAGASNAADGHADSCVMGLLPIARSDAFHLWAALVCIGLASQVTSRQVPSAAKLVASLAAAAAIPAAHFVFRRWYYGEWLPNTYYLKVAGMQGLFRTGAGYLKAFVESYAVAFILAVAAARWRSDRRIRWIAAASIFSIINVLLFGSDIFHH